MASPSAGKSAGSCPKFGLLRCRRHWGRRESVKRLGVQLCRSDQSGELPKRETQDSCLTGTGVMWTCSTAPASPRPPGAKGAPCCKGRLDCAPETGFGACRSVGRRPNSPQTSRPPSRAGSPVDFHLPLLVRRCWEPRSQARHRLPSDGGRSSTKLRNKKDCPWRCHAEVIRRRLTPY